MNRTFPFICLLMAFMLPFTVFPQMNMTQIGHLPYQEDLSDIWGYVDGNGKEYALVGVYNGFSIVDISNPANPVEVFFEQGANTIWRDVKVWGHYAYVTNEGGGGLLIADLSGLPNTVTTNTWTGPVGLSTAHNVFIDENGFIYIIGSNFGNGGVLILDPTQNPTNPTHVGTYDDTYVHDVFVRGDTLWTAEIYDGTFRAINVSNKANPVTMAIHNSPGNFCHNVWLSDDNKFIYTTDEISSGYIGVFDVSDLNNIRETFRFQSNPGSGVIPHNAFYHNGFVHISYYRDGAVVLDVHDPENVVEIGNYDTSPLAGDGFNGCWGVYPYLPSGLILATDIETGLHILSFNGARAAFLEGQVTNSGNGFPIPNASVSILGTTASTRSKITGNYKTGWNMAGTFDVAFSRTGFYSDTARNVQIVAGLVTILDMQLTPIPPLTLTVTTKESGNLAAIPGSKVLFVNADGEQEFTVGQNGTLTLNNFTGGSYEIYAGKWGYKTKMTTANLTQNGNIELLLDKGYYDDFLLDYDWVVTGDAPAGIWERAIPKGTTLGPIYSNPPFDVDNDFGSYCYVTGNNGVTAGDDDVDDGYTILTSPVFDLSDYNEPYIEYYWWFVNGGGFSPPNDSFIVTLTNGLFTQILDVRIEANTQMGQWNFASFRVKDFMLPTSAMQIEFKTMDLPGSGHIVEAAVDRFEVKEMQPISVPSLIAGNAKPEVEIHGNPFNHTTSIHWKLTTNEVRQYLLITDLQGRQLFRERIEGSGSLSWGKHARPGVYLLYHEANGKISFAGKMIKTD